MKTTTKIQAARLHLIIFGIFTLISLTVNADDSLNNIRPKIQAIADKLQKDNMVHFGYAVGYAAKPETNNKYFKLYKRLKSKATNQELVRLTNSKSEVLVVYSFNILHSRNYEGLKQIFLNHISDTSWFWTAGGCTGFVDRINWFMLRRLKPTDDTEINLLTKNEYDLYCDRFKQEDKVFTCD
ncbi:hypothetical protein L0U88_19530 [Flavihumibacter sp. RY-1]|uniref:Uncharacterized protein n=1 Tax=Flavihumibacter fluminis TaxID=2909236 RepID=A0ABS9BPB8_9BACT|nr:hypothetical protein [Flavihumibacter fluminis]MCF1716843.1 hypothetical protein [Flavihumibacter fluminis]